MNVRQASQYLGICPDTLYRYITEGEIPAFKLGNRWKLRKTILDRWMERKMSQAHATAPVELLDEYSRRKKRGRDMLDSAEKNKAAGRTGHRFELDQGRGAEDDQSRL